METRKKILDKGELTAGDYMVLLKTAVPNLGNPELSEADIEKDLSAEELQLNQSVISLNFENEKVSIQTNQQIFETGIVVSTLPPALLVTNIQFQPPFETAFIKIAKSTHTGCKTRLKWL